MPFPSPGDLPNPGIKPGFPALWADTLTFFQSGYIILRSHQESMRFPDTPYPPQPLWVPVFQILAILISAAVSHCIVSAICISSLVRCQSFGPLSNQVTFLLLSLKVLRVLGNSPLSCVLFASIFSKSVACLLVIFNREEITDFNQVQLINYFFLGLCLWCCT